jgi:hypothetical protein
VFASAVYLLCAATSVACGALLLRGYLAGRSRLLLWSSLCFALLAVQNSLLFYDLVIRPDLDLSLYREVAGLAGLSLLLFGLVWDGE